MVRLTNWFMNLIGVNVNLPMDLMLTSTLHHLHTVQQKSNNYKKVHHIWPLTTKTKKTVLVMVQNLPQVHNDWTGKQKPTFGTTVDTEKVKEHSLCQLKVQT